MARIISAQLGGYDKKSRVIMLDGETTAAIEILLLQFVKIDDGSILFRLDNGENLGERRKEIRITKKEGNFYFKNLGAF